MIGVGRALVEIAISTSRKAGYNGNIWLHSLPQIRLLPNVFVDLSGSGVDGGMLEACLETVGVGRLLWGCDLTIETGWAKLRSAAQDVITGCKFLRDPGRSKGDGWNKTCDTVVAAGVMRTLTTCGSTGWPKSTLSSARMGTRCALATSSLGWRAARNQGFDGKAHAVSAAPSPIAMTARALTLPLSRALRAGSRPNRPNQPVQPDGRR